MAQSTHHPNVWLDGKITPWADATIHVTQIGPASVSSVFEGIRGYWNDGERRLYIFQLDAHLRRFIQSIRLVRMTNKLTIDQLRAGILDLVRANDPHRDIYIRPFAYAESSTFGSSGVSEAHVVINTSDWDSVLKANPKSNACVSSWTRLSDNVMPPRVKASANYLNSRYASEEAKRNGYDHAIILNAGGQVAEGPGMCLMLVREGKLITPGVTSGILESVTRGTMMRLAREQLHLEVVEREVDRTELYAADEAFFCGTGIELMPIVTVDRLPVGEGKTGPITQNLLDCYHDIVRGMSPLYPEWRTSV